MKKIFSIVVLMFSVLCMFTACNKEQTRLSIDEIPGRAEITGTLYINYGETYVSGKLVDKILPAGDIDVIVKLTNSDFISGASGYTEYRTRTNADGKYSIMVPVLDKGVTVTVSVADILGTCSQFISTVGNQAKFEDVNGVFSFSKSVSGVKPGNIKIVNGEFDFEEED